MRHPSWVHKDRSPPYACRCQAIGSVLFGWRRHVSHSGTGAAGTSGVSYDGVWQGITYSPATVIVDDQFNLIAAACVDNELYAKFTGLSNYLDGGVILMNETFTVTGASRTSRVTGH